LFKARGTNLNLILISSSNVGNCPTGFLLDALFVVVSKKYKKAWKRLVVDNKLKREQKASYIS
jgi:hypothetical protein